MAVPRNATLLRSAPLKSGVILGVSPSSDPTFDVEIARATSSGVYATITRLTPKAGLPVSYTDLLPVDNFARTYKARAVKDGWLAGDYTSPISAKPVVLPEVAPNITPLTGRGIGINVFLSTGQQIQFGSAAVQEYYTKTLRLVASDCMAVTSTEQYAFNGSGELYPNSTNNSDHNYFSPTPLPIGAIITGLSSRVFRGTTGGKVTTTLQQINSTGGITGTATLTSTGTGYHTMATTGAVSFPASTAFTFNLLVVLRSNNAAKTNARFVWTDVTYQVPAVQVGI